MLEQKGLFQRDDANLQRVFPVGVSYLFPTRTFPLQSSRYQKETKSQVAHDWLSDR